MRTHAIKFTEPSRTQQHQKDETDINKIMARYVKTGVIDHINKHQAYYGENTGIEYQDAMNLLIKADEVFMELPSKVRKFFENDPAKFLEFTENPKNADKLVELGLAHPKSKPQSVEDAPKTERSVSNSDKKSEENTTTNESAPPASS
ncbi:internal scaffolding protein [Microviridae sp.]|nr:internal scaffolding protein [Microviridae sp.]